MDRPRRALQKYKNEFDLAEEPPNAVKVKAAMWTFPWPMCVKSPTAFPFSAVTRLEFGVSNFCVCVRDVSGLPAVNMAG